MFPVKSHILIYFPFYTHTNSNITTIAITTIIMKITLPTIATTLTLFIFFYNGNTNGNKNVKTKNNFIIILSTTLISSLVIGILITPIILVKSYNKTSNIGQLQD